MEIILKALADMNRLRLVNILTHNELCVCELEVMLNLTQTNVSRHLSKLKSAGVILSTKDAQWIHYQINPAFKSEHSDLYNYLIKQFEKQEPFLTDTKYLNNYVANNLNCSIIREDRKKVIKILSGLL